MRSGRSQGADATSSGVPHVSQFTLFKFSFSLGFLSTNCGEYSIANDGLQYAAAGPKALTLARRHANIVDELHAQYTDADGETV